MEQWLIRTADNRISGPYAKEQVRDLLKSGKLSLRDELCPANGYWIFLHEKQEVARQLGSDVLQWMSPTSDEATQTQTEPAFEKAQTRATSPTSPGSPISEDEPQTMVIQTRASQPASRANQTASSRSAAAGTPVLSSASGPSVTRWAMGGAIALLVFWLLARS